MAIAYNTSGSQTLSPTSNGTTKTGTINVGTGTDRILWVGFMQGSYTTDVVTGITYNGVSMTRLVGRQLNTSAQYISLYYLVNPTSGSNTLSVSLSSSCDYTYATFSVFTGAPSATTVIGTNTASADVASGNLALTLTTQGDNAWIVSIARSTDTGDNIPGSNTTERTDLAIAMGDTNGAQTPTGSYANNWSAGSGGNKMGGVAGHFYVSSSASTNSNFFAFM